MHCVVKRVYTFITISALIFVDNYRKNVLTNIKAYDIIYSQSGFDCSYMKYATVLQ